MEVQVHRKPELTGAVAFTDKGPHDVTTAITQEHAARGALEDRDPAIGQSPRGDDLMQWAYLIAEDDDWVWFDAPGVDRELGCA